MHVWTLERVVRRRHDLVDGNLSVGVNVAGGAGGDTRLAQGDIDHGDHFIDRDSGRRVAVAGADARRQRTNGWCGCKQQQQDW